jgi:DNA-binding MarR family transcriptional regulator
MIQSADRPKNNNAKSLRVTDVTSEISTQGYSREIASILHAGLAKLTRRMRSITLPPGMTPERLSTLAAIDAHGPVSVTALADAERVRPATMSRMISSLVDDGLVRRQEDKDDRRGVLVVTTAKGKRSYERARQQYLSQLGKALTQLEPQQLEALRSLAAALENLDRALER